ncbi:hypothetical protein PORY_000713 [Pneumocystis oryctolagi]|uniref:Uncharacterized protein n=1 Tax=Pneumocystis oryctolagi TaxID=42067 RepID=A0ACB7CDZ8_9ASCO|nr:hypothetical protein PORY_000713 [Pneumocystis oryctolagi]
MDSVLFTHFQNKLYDSFVSTIKAVSIFRSYDVDFYRSLDPYFASSLTSCNRRLLDLINFLIQLVSYGKFGKIEDHEDLDCIWLDIVDAVDFLFEKADMFLNEFKELIKQSDYKINDDALKDTKVIKKKKKLAYKFVHAENILRPQLRFSTAPDNDPDTPWKMKITVKPNALVPLNNCILENSNERYKSSLISSLHPYEYEINNIKYSDELFKEKKPINPISFNDSKVIWVNTIQLLENMVIDLKKTTEIAIDLEHHDYRSYQGFVCLMQISTRSIDWIVDTLELREELEVLNEVFTDSNIMKVFHGASMDIIWLQRDFGLYIVGLFDTYHAARILGFEGHSLAFLLKKYVNFDSDKRYQLADWRIRPLPEEMLSYARSDTHFLLYIYDRLKNELLLKSTLSRNLLSLVLSASNNVALRVFEKDRYDADGSGVDGWKNMLQKWGNCLTSDFQISVFIALHQWRDKIARQEDESVRYVLPNHVLIQIAAGCPDDVASVFSICNYVPPLVRVHVDEIVQIIRSVKESELKKISSVNKSKVDSIPKNLHFFNDSVGVKNTSFIDHDKLFQNDFVSTKLMCLVTKSSVFWKGVIENDERDSKLSTVGNILKDMQLISPLPSLSKRVFLDDDCILLDKDSLSINKNNLVDNTIVDGNLDYFYYIYLERCLEQYKKNQDDDIIMVKKIGRKQKRLFEVSRNESKCIATEEDNELLDEFDKSMLLLGNRSDLKERKRRKKSSRKTKLVEKILDHDKKLELYDYEKEPSFFDQLDNNYLLKNERTSSYGSIKIGNEVENFKQPKCENAPKNGFRSMIFGK